MKNSSWKSSRVRYWVPGENAACGEPVSVFGFDSAWSPVTFDNPLCLITLNVRTGSAVYQRSFGGARPYTESTINTRTDRELFSTRPRSDAERAMETWPRTDFAPTGSVEYGRSHGTTLRSIYGSRKTTTGRVFTYLYTNERRVERFPIV